MLIEQIRADLDTARKDHDTLVVGLLTTLYSDINMIGKNALRDTTDAEAISIVKKFIKSIDDTLNLIGEKDGDSREIYRSKLIQERSILEKYVPQQLDEQDLYIIIRNLIDVGIINTMPLIMKELKAKYSGQYDGALASKIVKELLM